MILIKHRPITRRMNSLDQQQIKDAISNSTGVELIMTIIIMERIVVIVQLLVEQVEV